MRRLFARWRADRRNPARQDVENYQFIHARAQRPAAIGFVTGPLRGRSTMAMRTERGNIVSMAEAKASRANRDNGSRDAIDLREIIAAQSEIAQAGLDLRQMVDTITTKLQALTGSTGAVVEMLDGHELAYWSASGSVRQHVGLRIPAIGSLSGLCVVKKTLLVCTDSEVDPRVNREACRRVGLRSALIAPLLCEGELVGVLKVLSDKPNAYGARHVELVQTLAAFIGSMLHSALEHARVSAIVDKAMAVDAGAAAKLEDERWRIEALIASGGIRPVFQPIVELASGKVVGFEGLSRFDGTVSLSVDEWFDMANRAGMCVELEAACVAAIVESLAHAPAIDGYIAINVSPKTVMEFDFDALPDRSRQGGWVLEITEHSEVTDYPVLARRVRALQAKGFRIAIDDAGAGYSSLRHVLKLAPDIVKLDVSISRDIDTMVRNQQLSSAIISFSRETGMALVAEGVETVAERDTLARLGVEYGQGYLFGRPAPLTGAGGSD
jgi:EAL domain-containing protein (putative c-di-GMP-specific phosphodiesterase class I)